MGFGWARPTLQRRLFAGGHFPDFVEQFAFGPFVATEGSPHRILLGGGGRFSIGRRGRGRVILLHVVNEQVVLVGLVAFDGDTAPGFGVLIVAGDVGGYDASYSAGNSDKIADSWRRGFFLGLLRNDVKHPLIAVDGGNVVVFAHRVNRGAECARSINAGEANVAECLGGRPRCFATGGQQTCENYAD